MILRQKKSRDTEVAAGRYVKKTYITRKQRMIEKSPFKNRYHHYLTYLPFCQYRESKKEI